MLASVPDASALTRLPCLVNVNVPLSTYCKIQYILKFTVASCGSPRNSTAFLCYILSMPLSCCGQDKMASVDL